MDQQIIGLLFDASMAVTVIWLAWRSLHEIDLFKSIMLYIVFGLMVSLSWIRLKAPDVALAEAAIGAGLTGALFVVAYRRIMNNYISPKDLEINKSSE